MREDDFELKFGKLNFPNDIIIERGERRKQKIVITTKRIATKTVRQIQKESASQYNHHIYWNIIELYAILELSQSVKKSLVYVDSV